MSQRIRGVAVALAVAALPACYTSEKPLDPTPQVDLDPALLGAWRCVGADPQADADGGTSLTVERGGPRLYHATLHDDGDPTPDLYEAYGSRVAGTTVLNVREMEGDWKAKNDWVFMRYELARPQVLIIEVASEDALKGVESTPASLKSALAKRARSKGLYQLSCVCVRARQPG